MTRRKPRPLTATRIGSKATTPSVASAQRASRNGGAVSAARKHAESPGERWAAAVDGVLARFRADMALRYDEPDTPGGHTDTSEAPFIAPRATQTAKNSTAIRPREGDE